MHACVSCVGAGVLRTAAAMKRAEMSGSEKPITRAPFVRGNYWTHGLGNEESNVVDVNWGCSPLSGCYPDTGG